NGAVGALNLGLVTGAGTITKTGTGTLNITTASPGYTGAVVANAGALQITQDTGIAGTNIINSGGTLPIRSPAALGTTGAIVLNGGGVFGPQNDNNTTFNAAVTVAGNATIQTTRLNAASTATTHTISSLAIGTNTLTFGQVNVNANSAFGLNVA